MPALQAFAIVVSRLRRVDHSNSEGEKWFHFGSRKIESTHLFQPNGMILSFRVFCVFRSFT